MKIVFTSDLHLDPAKDERLAALDRILELCRDQSADKLVISGDLFDSANAADILRPFLRDKFSGLGFDVMVIPGNHDYTAYTKDLDFGSDIKVLDKRPYSRLDYGQISIFALPYSNQDFSDIAFELGHEKKNEGLNMLLLHCSLDIGSLREDEFGDEKRQLYLPVSSKLLGSLGFSHVFAGHFHSSYLEKKISDDTMFIYCGSPVSITKKEKGKRKAVVFDSSLAPLEKITTVDLDTFYYQDLDIVFSPGEEIQALNDLKDILVSYIEEDAMLSINLKGLIAFPEKELAQKVKEIVDKALEDSSNIESQDIELSCSYTGIGEVYDDPLFKVFQKRLTEEQIDKDMAEKIKKIVLKQFSLLKR